MTLCYNADDKRQPPPLIQASDWRHPITGVVELVLKTNHSVTSSVLWWSN